VQVIRIGSTTCGKPYGFTQKNNCGFAYFPIEFQGANAQGLRRLSPAGFAPTCQM
jgi:carboxyl-terminal processing protease